MKSPAQQPSFFADVERVILPLRDSLREVTAAGFGGDRRQTGVVVNPTLRSRLTRGMGTDHLPTMLYHLPGPDGLRRFLAASKRAGVARDVIERCEDRIDAFEEFLKRENVSRDGLHAMVSDQSPEAHTSVVRTNAQAVHKAMTNLLGYCAEGMLTAMILMPGTSPGRVNLAQIRGFSNLQRIRTGAWFITSGYGRTAGDAAAPRTLDGQPVNGDRSATLLTRYCSDPLPTFEMRHAGRRQVYQLKEHEIGERSSSTFYFGEMIPDAYPDPPDEIDDGPAGSDGGRDSTRRAMISSIIATPSKRLHFDLLIHREVWPGASVTLDTFRTVPHGPVDESSVADRRFDRIDLGATLQQFDAASGTLAASRIPQYGRMMDDALDRLGIERESLRVHRCEVVYPLHGTQFALRFEAT